MSAFEQVARTLGKELGPERLLEVIHEAEQRHTDFTELFGLMTTERESWILAFLTGYMVRERR